MNFAQIFLIFSSCDLQINWKDDSALFSRNNVLYTVEPRFNKPLFNEVLDQCPGQSYSKMYGKEPRYNEPSI